MNGGTARCGELMVGRFDDRVQIEYEYMRSTINAGRRMQDPLYILYIYIEANNWRTRLSVGCSILRLCETV